MDKCKWIQLDKETSLERPMFHLWDHGTSQSYYPPVTLTVMDKFNWIQLDKETSLKGFMFHLWDHGTTQSY